MDPRAQQIADYFHVSLRLQPHLAELLADFSELGSDPGLVVGWLGSRGLGRGSRVWWGALCSLRVGDLRDAVRTEADYDALLFVSVGGVLGTPSESIGALRRCVRPGGVIIVQGLGRPWMGAARTGHLNLGATARCPIMCIMETRRVAPT